MQSVQPMHVASSMRAMAKGVVPSAKALDMALFYRRPSAVRLLHSKSFRGLPTSPFAHMPAFDGPSAGASPRARLAAKALAFCGWRTVIVEPVPEKAVIIFYPHTSNWDFVIGDYPRREVGVAGYLDLSGEPLRDIAAIAAFYDGRTGKRPALQTPIRFAGAPPAD